MARLITRWISYIGEKKLKLLLIKKLGLPCIASFLLCMGIMVSIFLPLGQTSLHSISAASSAKVDLAPSVTIQSVLKGKVPEDPLLPIKAATRAGKLVYSFMSKSDRENNNPTCYLVLRTMQADESNIRNPKSVFNEADTLTYKLKVNNGAVCEPRFSPDGNHILLQIGFGVMQYDTFRLYILDLKTQSLKLLSPKQLTYRHVLWSPDSRYIAYFMGGDAEGIVSDRFSKPLELWIYDLGSGEHQLVAKNDTLRSNVAWGGSHTLYYGMLVKSASTSVVKKSKDVIAQPTPIERPNIWAYSIENAKSSLIVKDGYRPNIAYDNEIIAFYGSEDPSKPVALRDDWIWRTGAAALTVMKVNGKGRKPLSIIGGESTFSVWKHDGHHLLTIKQKNGTPNVRSEVEEWDITTGKRKVIGDIKANDFEESPRMSIYPSIKPLSVSEDDKSLLLLTQEYVGAEGQWLNQVDSVKAIDLTSGKISTIAQIMNSLGTDWRDEATSIEENASTVLR